MRRMKMRDVRQDWTTFWYKTRWVSGVACLSTHFILLLSQKKAARSVKFFAMCEIRRRPPPQRTLIFHLCRRLFSKFEPVWSHENNFVLLRGSSSKAKSPQIHKSQIPSLRVPTLADRWKVSSRVIPYSSMKQQTESRTSVALLDSLGSLFNYLVGLPHQPISNLRWSSKGVIKS